MLRVNVQDRAVAQVVERFAGARGEQLRQKRYVPGAIQDGVSKRAGKIRVADQDGVLHTVAQLKFQSRLSRVKAEGLAAVGGAGLGLRDSRGGDLVNDSIGRGLVRVSIDGLDDAPRVAALF